MVVILRALELIGILLLALVVREQYNSIKNKPEKSFHRIVVCEILATACFIIVGIYEERWFTSAFIAICAVAIIWIAYQDKKKKKTDNKVEK